MSEIITQEKLKSCNHNQEEARLQARIVRLFSERYPDRRGCLIGTFQNTSSYMDGAKKLSLGLVPGVSDLIYFRPLGETIGIELKYCGSKHNKAHILRQAQWLEKVPTIGRFCDNEDDFLDIIEGKGGGITPQQVLAYLATAKGSSIVWDSKKICGENLEFNV